MVAGLFVVAFFLHKLTSSEAGEVPPLEENLCPRLQCGSAVPKRSPESPSALPAMDAGLSVRL